MSDVQGQLKEIGINARDGSGELKNALDIYKEVAEAMEQGRLSSEEFNKAALALGGRRHVTRVTALIESMQSLNGEQSLYEKQLEDSMNSQGSATRENLTHMQSISAEQKVLIAQAQELAAVSGEQYLEQGYRDLLNTLQGLTQTATNVVNKFGLLPPIFATVSTAVVLFSSRITSATTYTKAYGAASAWLELRLGALKASFINARTAAQTATVGMTGFSRATKGAAIAVGTFGKAIKGALITTGIGAGIVVLTTLIGKFMEKSAQARAEQREFREELDKMVVSYDQNENKIKKSIDRYEELKNKTKLSNDEQEEFQKLQNDIAGILPNTVKKIDDQGDAHLRNVDAIKEEIKELNRLSQLRAEAYVESGYQKDIESSQDNINDIKKQIQELKYEKINVGANQVELAEKDLTADERLQLGQLENKLKDQMDTIDEFNRKYASSVAKAEDANVSLNQNQMKFIDNISETVEESGNATTQIDGFIDKVSSLSSTLRSSLDSKTINDLGEDQIESLNGYVDALHKQNEGHKDADRLLKNYKTQLVESENGYELVRLATNAYTSSLEENTVANEENADALDENEKETWEKASASQVLTGVTEEQTDKMKQAIKVVSLLSKIENLNAQQKDMLSGATSYLSEMYPHLSGKIVENIDVIAAEIDMMGALNNVSGDNANVMMQNQDNLTQSTIEASNQRIQALMKEYDVLREIMNNHIKANLATDGMVASNGFIQNVAREMGNVESKLSDAYNTRRNAIYGIEGVDRPDIDTSSSSGSSGSSSSSASKATDAQKEAFERAEKALIPYLDKLNGYQNQLEHLRIDRKMLEEGSDEYIDSLNKENDLLEKQRKANQSYRDAIKNLIKTENLSEDKKRELQDRISKLSLDYHKLESTIYDNNKAMKEFNKTVKKSEEDIFNERKSAADKTISTLKEYHQTRIKMLEDEKQAELDIIDEQLKKYEEAHNARIQMLDREQEDETHAKDLEKLQDRKKSLQEEIQVLSLNDSSWANAKRIEKQQELNETELDLEAMKSKRQRDMRKRNLQDELENKREEIRTERQKVEDELEIKRYEIQEKLNDERYWADMRKDIISGNVTEINSLLEGAGDDLEDYMQNLNKRMEEDASETIGNMKVTIQELKNQMSDIDSSVDSNDRSTSGVNSNDNISDGVQYDGKYYSGDKTSQLSGKNTDNMKIFEDGKSYSYDDYVDKLLGYDTGGYTGSWGSGKQGKLAMLHEKELVLNKADTSNILKAVNLTRDFVSKLKDFKPSVNNNSSPTFSPVFNVNVDGGDKNAGKRIANDAFDTMQDLFRDMGK